MANHGNESFMREQSKIYLSKKKKKKKDKDKVNLNGDKFYFILSYNLHIKGFIPVVGQH
jgi:hypothetical protein